MKLEVCVPKTTRRRFTDAFKSKAVRSREIPDQAGTLLPAVLFAEPSPGLRRMGTDLYHP